MRCLACNKQLSDFESTRKSTTGHYIDLCNHCFYSGVHQSMHVVEREDLRGVKDEDDDVPNEDEVESWD